MSGINTRKRADRKDRDCHRSCACELAVDVVNLAMPTDGHADALREQPAPYSPPPEMQRLIDELYREEIIEARKMSLEEKFFAGQSLFEAACRVDAGGNPKSKSQCFRRAGTLFKVEVFRLSRDPHDQERFRRRTALPLEGQQVFFPKAEDVIIWELRWARSKDRDDVRAIIGVQQDKLDWPYIETWCDRHGTRTRLEEIRRTVPKV